VSVAQHKLVLIWSHPIINSITDSLFLFNNNLTMQCNAICVCFLVWFSCISLSLSLSNKHPWEWVRLHTWQIKTNTHACIHSSYKTITPFTLKPQLILFAPHFLLTPLLPTNSQSARQLHYKQKWKILIYHNQVNY
jgi:hypothetical protein